MLLTLTDPGSLHSPRRHSNAKLLLYTKQVSIHCLNSGPSEWRHPQNGGPLTIAYTQ